MTSTTSCTTPMKRPSNHRRDRRIAVLIAGLVLLLSAPLAARMTPSDVINAVSSEVIEVLRDKSIPISTRKAKVEAIIYRYIDFETLSRLVMARNWRNLSDAQQVEFMKEFKKHLSHTYGDNIDNFRNEKVAILSEREEKRGDVTVKSKILRGGTDDILVDYRLRQRDKNWRIIDVVIEGVSMVANFRSQFQEIMTSGGPDRLLELLREKNLDPPAA